LGKAQSLRRISDGLDHLVVLVCVILVVVMLTISLMGVAFEVMFKLFEEADAAQAFTESTLYWIYSQTRPSMTRLFLPWLAMLSITAAFKRGEHIAISVLVRRLPAWAVRAMQTINLVVVAAFGVALIWYGIPFFENSTQLFMISDQLQVSHKWTALSIPVCGVIMCVHLLSGLALVEWAELKAEEFLE
jgi:TRAP-type C4-dicarboxylate transport system permease small subunit